MTDQQREDTSRTEKLGTTKRERQNEEDKKETGRLEDAKKKRKLKGGRL